MRSESKVSQLCYHLLKNVYILGVDGSLAEELSLFRCLVCIVFSESERVFVFVHLKERLYRDFGLVPSSDLLNRLYRAVMLKYRFS